MDVKGSGKAVKLFETCECYVTLLTTAASLLAHGHNLFRCGEWDSGAKWGKMHRVRFGKGLQLFVILSMDDDKFVEIESIEI